MTAWLSKDEVVDRIMLGDSILTALVDVVSLVDMVARALVLDGHLVTSDQVWREVIAPPMVENGMGAPGEEADRYQAATVIFMNYADWVANVGKVLGVDPDADIQPDRLSQNPCTQTVTRAMASIAAKVSLAASAAYETCNGHSMMDVFMASIETGEDFEQSRTRLTARRNGLRAVK